jgi:hypothetical protein
MKMNTNYIDTYVSEVGRRLPGKTRADIEAEIRSILQDMLEERSQEAGKPVDDEMTLEVLKAYGAPDKVAATYLGERFLIGPRLYPIFMLVARIVLIVLGVLAAAGLGIALYQASQTPWDAFTIIFKAIANLIASVITALGNIVIIFAIIEWALFRAGVKADIKGMPKEKEWDPRSLARLSTPNRVKVGETIIEIVGCFVIIVIFNFYPQIIGFTSSLNGVAESGWAIGFRNVTFIPLLSEAFFNFVPYLTLVWGLTILLDIVLLRLGQWNLVTHICLVGLKVVNIIIVAAMLGVPTLLAVTTATLTTALGDPQAAGTLMTLLTQIVKVALWITIFGNGIEIIKAITLMARNDLVPIFTGQK